MQFQKLEHIAIMVEDMDRSIAFYTTVLELPLVERRTFHDLELAFLQVGDTLIELIAGDSGYSQADGVVNHIAFTVNQLDTAVAHLKARDAQLEITEPNELWNGLRCVFLRGPDNERLELFERPS